MRSALANPFHLYPPGWLFFSGLRKVTRQHYSLLLELPHCAPYRGETSFALSPHVTSVDAGSRTVRSSHPGFGALRLCSLSPLNLPLPLSLLSFPSSLCSGRVFPPVLTALLFPRRLAALFSMHSLISSRLRRGAAKIEMRDKRPIEAAGEPWLHSLLPPIYSCRTLFICFFIPII